MFTIMWFVNSFRYVGKRSLVVPNWRLSFLLARIQVFSIFLCNISDAYRQTRCVLNERHLRSLFFSKRASKTLSSSLTYLPAGSLVTKTCALFEHIRGWPYCLQGGHGSLKFTGL